ncbi:MAG: low temperature requirement protein, partial [Thermoleophilia bacterium]|nr:low temperature requirement protein [Thermoleophilia bacterium]
MSRSPALPHRTEQKGVSTLELFFDLVFVLAIAQVTLLMSHHPTWEGLAQGVVVLGLLWWGWVGYSWLTSVVNPEHLSVRLPLFGAMSGFAVAAMAVPTAFEKTGVVFVCAYALVSFGQVALMYVAGRDHAPMRRSTGGLAVGAALSTTLLALGLVLGDRQLEFWLAGLLLYVAVPLIFGSEGWLLTPTHFTERHSLIVIVALGESIIAVGAGATHPERLGEITVVFAGTLIAFCLWWVYFDVLSIVAEHRLEAAEPGRVQNELARDAYSYLHFPMIAGIVLGALGLKKAIAHVDQPLEP